MAEEKCEHIAEDGFCYCELGDNCPKCGYRFGEAHHLRIMADFIEADEANESIR